MIAALFMMSFLADRASSQDTLHMTSRYFIDESSPIFKLDSEFPHISTLDIIRGLSPHGYRGNVRRIHNALRKAMEKKVLNVVVMGGSMPLGAGLGPNSYHDRWPRQLQNMLGEVFKIKVRVHNLGIRAVSSDSQAQNHFNFIM
jgi:hypothetical protein